MHTHMHTHTHTCTHTHIHTHTVAFFDDYFRSHDHLGYIGGDRNATVAAASMYVPQSMFGLPMPPPQHYAQVCLSVCLYVCVSISVCLSVCLFVSSSSQYVRPTKHLRNSYDSSTAFSTCIYTCRDPLSPLIAPVPNVVFFPPLSPYPSPLCPSKHLLFPLPTHTLTASHYHQAGIICSEPHQQSSQPGRHSTKLPTTDSKCALHDSAFTATVTE